MNKQKVVLIILDGWGYRDKKEGNAITLAKTPHFNRLWHFYPHAILPAAGEAVGLPNGQMGTSEVNHMIIGAGRIIYQHLLQINHAIKNKSFFKNKAFLSIFDFVKEKRSSLHLLGLVSPGGVHSHQQHLYALLKAAKINKLKRVYIHIFTDGRDTPPKSAEKYLVKLKKYMQKIKIGRIASISGRYYAMDRDHNWERTEKVFNLLIKGKGEKFSNLQTLFRKNYQENITDEFIKPAFIAIKEKKKITINDNDGLIFFNFRNDRIRQLVALILKKGPKNIKIATFTRYHPRFPVLVAFPEKRTKNTLGEIISNAGLKQLRITETEKFAHLTFFLNCKKEKPFKNEKRFMFPSYSDIKTHDQRPQMRTLDIAKMAVREIKKQKYDAIFINLCNADMVGHTGNLKAAIKGIETIDKALGQIVPAGLQYNYHLIITADHGNAEEMVNSKDKSILTSHSLNPVPLILISKKKYVFRKGEKRLIDIAPTILKILGLPKPAEMTGKSLI